MAKKILILLFTGLIVFGSLTGCYTAGKATGEAAEEIEKGAEEFEEGYEEGKEDW